MSGTDNWFTSYKRIEARMPLERALVTLAAPSSRLRTRNRRCIGRVMRWKNTAPHHASASYWAKVMLDGGGVIDCTVRDRSLTGARLKVVSVVGIPDRFGLLIGTDG